MKKYFVLFLLTGVAIFLATSCSESDDALVDANYLDSNFQKAFGDSTVTDYPSAIDDFVAANYPQDTIEEVELDSLGNFEVELASGTELLFDSAGGFIEVLPDDDGEMDTDEGSDSDDDEAEDEGEDDDDDSDDDDVDDDDADHDGTEDDADDAANEDDSDMDNDEVVTDYPTAIDEYISANHPGTSIVEIELEDDGSYEVELDDGTEIIFDSEGNFVEYDD